MARTRIAGGATSPRMFMFPRSMCPLLCALLWTAACDRTSQVAGPDAQAADGDVDAPRPLPAVQTSDQLCKLLNDANVSDPTPNQVQFRANVLGADLGIPVVAGETLYLLFGDTIGFAGIWGAESHPDAVGYATQPASAVAANPAVLCDGLGIVRLPPSASIGPSVDGRVEADFAGVAMIAPAGHALDEYIHNPAGGATRFPQLPGDFEVPSGAFEDGGAIYAFYTTVVSPSDITMVGSYLARWDAPATDAIPAYQILYGVDARDGGALGGDFINIAAVAHGEYVYLFGTGRYRASPVHVARKGLAALASSGGFERLDAASGTWSSMRGAPIIATAAYGETSVRYFAAIDRWMFLAEELTPVSNRIVASFADRPEGPWSAPIVVHDMADAALRARYCCAADACHGVQFMNCDRTGFYGAYLFPDVAVHGDRFTVTYTLSSFDPYNVALFQATFGPP